MINDVEHTANTYQNISNIYGSRYMFTIVFNLYRVIFNNGTFNWDYFIIMKDFNFIINNLKILVDVFIRLYQFIFKYHLRMINSMLYFVIAIPAK